MTADEMRTQIEQALHPRRFFLGGGLDLRLAHQPPSDRSWGIFRGHLLDERQTRDRRMLESWDVLLDENPCLSVKLDAAGECIYITRSLQVYAWEAYSEGSGEIHSREARRWVAELVGTIDLRHVADAEELRRLLERYLFAAVVGACRLPITSLESPLPGYTLGVLGYFYGIDRQREHSMRQPGELIAAMGSPDITELVRVKLLELALRSTKVDDIPVFVHALTSSWSDAGRTPDELRDIMRSLFNHVSLSPYTSFVDCFIELLLGLRSYLGPASVIDLVSYCLRHLVRHLTAYDLVTFHNQGANYPDALFLDRLLIAYLALIRDHSDEFMESSGVSRLRRRALRQAWLIRKHYEGHPVPDAPTSPGENLRVMPRPFERVPDDQISAIHSRTRRLYDDTSLEERQDDYSREVLKAAVEDLRHPSELVELGMATFLDRPLGVFKAPGEVDRTPMLSYEAFSLKIAAQRLDELRQWELVSSPDEHRRLLELLRLSAPKLGLPASELPGRQRPGVVSLEDAQRASDDFLFLRTTASSQQSFLGQYDFAALKTSDSDAWSWLLTSRQVLLIRTAEGVHSVFDESMQPRMRFEAVQDDHAAVRYLEYDGTEYLEQGLWVRPERFNCASRTRVRALPRV